MGFFEVHRSSGLQGMAAPQNVGVFPVEQGGEGVFFGGLAVGIDAFAE